MPPDFTEIRNLVHSSKAKHKIDNESHYLQNHDCKINIAFHR